MTEPMHTTTVGLLARIFCALRHRWVETSRITWKDDGASTGSAIDKCTRCGTRRRRFLQPGTTR